MLSRDKVAAYLPLGFGVFAGNAIFGGIGRGLLAFLVYYTFLWIFGFLDEDEAA